MPQSVDEWLLARHLARFEVEVVEGLDLWAMTKSGLLSPNRAVEHSDIWLWQRGVFQPQAGAGYV